jgi:GNAT superfamily N-acetyltransferase
MWLEGAVVDLLVEKAALTPTRDVVPSKEWGRPYVRSLRAMGKKTHGELVVAEVLGERAGIALGAPCPFPKWELRYLEFRRPCQLMEMYVVPRFRHLKVGEKLIAEVERRFARRGYDWMVAFHHGGHRYESNLYRRCGLRVYTIGMGKWLGKSRSR